MTVDSEQELRAADLATRFVAARRTCSPLSVFPGDLPDSLAQAYRCQDAAIDLWQKEIGGWKVGRIPPEFEQAMGCDRLAGPIFRPTIRCPEATDCPEMPVFGDGFAAIEAEFVAVIDADAPVGKLHWSLPEVAEVIGDLHIGLEIASSPLATINAIGPLAVVSDFGNNGGLLVGPAIAGWRDRPLHDLRCESFIDGRSMGAGGAANLTGGYLRSVQFMLELAAERGRPLTRGTIVATGQTTGIHDIAVGQEAMVDFGPDGSLCCRAVAAQAV